MRLFEINSIPPLELVNDTGGKFQAHDTEELKNRLQQIGKIDITNGSYSNVGWTLGTLEDIGAGKISRKNLPYQGKWFGFEYNTELPDGSPIKATLKLHSGRIMEPGDSFMENV